MFCVIRCSSLSGSGHLTRTCIYIVHTHIFSNLSQVFVWLHRNKNTTQVQFYGDTLLCFFFSFRRSYAETCGWKILQIQLVISTWSILSFHCSARKETFAYILTSLAESIISVYVCDGEYSGWLESLNLHFHVDCFLHMKLLNIKKQ